MRKTKIVVIGAGSASFGLVNLGAILRTEELNGSTLCLVDVDPVGLDLITKLARRMNQEWHAGMEIISTTERNEVLEGAEYVILSVAIDREACWKSDVEIALKYGIRHYGENGGPGALIHTARNVNLILPILKDIERHCPEAWVLNFTNPVPRMCIAAARFTKLKIVGICHAIDFAYVMLAKFFKEDCGFDIPDDYAFTWQQDWSTYGKMAQLGKERYDVKAAGINHFTWIVSIKDRQSGEEVLPELKKRFLDSHFEFEPYTREILSVFGELPVSGDCHMLEYLPFTHNVQRKSWERFDIQMYPLDQASQNRDEMWEKIEAMSRGEGSIEELRHAHSERAEQLIVAMLTGNPLYDQAVNLPNRGYITNLPEGAIVEVPALIDAHGIHGIGVGKLPDTVAEWCRREIFLAEKVVAAVVNQDKKALLEAMALDPMVDDLTVARNLLEEYLSANQKYLPMFGD